MQGAKGRHLLFEVLEDRLVHAGAKLLRALAVPRVVREAAPRALELPRVEDKLPARPCAARLGGRGRVRVLVGNVDRGTRGVGDSRINSLAGGKAGTASTLSVVFRGRLAP